MKDIKEIPCHSLRIGERYIIVRGNIENFHYLTEGTICGFEDKLVLVRIGDNIIKFNSLNFSFLRFQKKGGGEKR